MTKKFEPVRIKVPLPGGGFIDAFRMALVEMTCLGERRFELTGYPLQTEAESLASDWDALGLDFRAAAQKVLTGEIDRLKEAEQGDRTPRSKVSAS